MREVEIHSVVAQHHEDTSVVKSFMCKERAEQHAEQLREKANTEDQICGVWNSLEREIIAQHKHHVEFEPYPFRPSLPESRLPAEYIAERDRVRAINLRRRSEETQALIDVRTNARTHVLPGLLEAKGLPHAKQAIDEALNAPVDLCGYSVHTSILVLED